MTAEEQAQVNAEMDEAFPDVPYTEDQLEAMHRDHLADLQKTRDLLTDDDKMAAFWRLRHPERFDA